MKRIISSLLVAVLCLSLCSCDGDTIEANNNTPSLSGNAGQQENTDHSPNNSNEENNDNLNDADNSQSVHTHSWTNATCTTPKTCTCGAKEGKANGHSWKNATCSQPKTCTICGTTSGLTAGHNFSDGKCTLCGKNDPDYAKVTMVWIPTKGGTKYHSKAGCSNMDSPEQVTKSQAESLGFAPCKRCY